MQEWIRTFRPLPVVIFTLAFAVTAFADGSHDRTQVGHNISIGPDEDVSEATCFGCSIRVRGHVAGDLTAFGGSIILEDQADVGGDVTSFAGDIRLDQETKVGGDVTVFGGKLRRESSASVGGDVTNMGGGGWIVLIFVLPFVVLGAFIAFVVWLIRRLLRPSIPAAA